MYHLFNRMYVEVEGRAHIEQAQVNISENTGFEFIEHPNGLQRGAQLGYAISLDEYTPESFAELLAKANGYADKVMFYVDGKTYVRLYAALLKSLFPGIDYDTFKMFFICIKATFDTSTVNFHDVLVDHGASVTINRAIVNDLYSFEEPLLEPIKDLLGLDPNGISLEWRVVKLRARQEVGTIPFTIKNIMRRTALSNSHDAMDDWGRVIADPARWEFSGCDEDSLLDADSTFSACKNFGPLTEPFLRMPGAMDARGTDKWMIELLENIVKVLESCGDLPSATRSKNLLECFRSNADLSAPVNCLERLKMLFDGGPARFRLAHLDSAKYDENLIRYVLRLPDEKIQKLMEHSEW